MKENAHLRQVNRKLGREDEKLRKKAEELEEMWR